VDCDGEKAMPDEKEDQSGSSGVAQCGACQEIIAIDSNECPSCGVSFGGIEGVDQGECGKCNALVPLDSKSCPDCGISFVMDDLIQTVREWMVSEGLSVIDVFGKWDSNDDGVISRKEIRDGLLSDGIAVLPEHEVDRFLLQVDLNKDHEVQLGELAAALLLPLSEETSTDDADDAEEDKAVADLMDLIDDSPSKDSKKTESDEEESDDAGDDDGDDVADDSDDSDADTDDSDDADSNADDSDDSDADTDAEDSEEAADDDDADESGDDDDSSDVDDETDDDDSEDDVDADEEDDTDSAVDAFTRLIEAVEASSESSRGLFEKLDRNESDNVDPNEFKDTVRELMNDDFSDKDLDSIISAMDTDDDGFLDIVEITSALEDPEEVIDEIEKPKREGPAEWQRFLMRHYENLFPIAFVLLGIFIGIWLVNGAIGPVDGSGGAIAFDGAEDAFLLGGIIEPGEIYPCDKSIQESGCKNSLTPFGENSSMPKGFYGDGIAMMILGLFGIIATFILRMKTSVWRDEFRVKAESGDDEEEDSSEDEEDSSDEDDSDDEDDDDEDGDEDEDDDDEDEDEDDGADEEIELGSKVGVEHGGEEWSGTIIEFDDEEDEVLVKNDDDDEEVWVPFDALFVE